MPSHRLHREDQAAYLRDVVDAADRRSGRDRMPAKPAIDSPNRCVPNLRTGRHTWHRGRDDRLRCFHCCAVQLADGRIVRVSDPDHPGNRR